MTPQEQRDQDYLEGYGDGLTDSSMGYHLQPSDFNEHSVSYARGYRDAVKDRELAHSRAAELLQVRPELAKHQGGEPA